MTNTKLDNSWIEATFKNLPNVSCKVYVCIDGVPQKRQRNLIVRNDNKIINCARNSKEITHFKL